MFFYAWESPLAKIVYNQQRFWKIKLKAIIVFFIAVCLCFGFEVLPS
jgi:hypothetical protein